MSRARGLFPIAIATVIGIGTGVMIWQPALKEETEHKEQANTIDFKEQHSPSPEVQMKKTEEAVANAGGATTIPKDTARWSEVQAGQFSKPENTFSWADVPLDQYSFSGKSS